MKIPTKRIIIKMVSMEELRKDHNPNVFHVRVDIPNKIVTAINWMYNPNRYVGGHEILMIGDESR